MTSEKSSAQLLNEYMEAHEKHAAMLNRYMPVRNYQPGQRIEPGAMITPEIIEELARIGDEERAAQQAWMEAVRAGR